MEKERERERANFLVEYDTDTILIIDLKGVTKRLLQMLHPVAKVGWQIDRPDMKHGPFNSSSSSLSVSQRRTCGPARTFGRSCGL